jgi:hypothetical protein
LVSKKPNKIDYEFYPGIYYSQLKTNKKLLSPILFTGAYSTKAVALVQRLRLDTIEIFKHSKE